MFQRSYNRNRFSARPRSGGFRRGGFRSANRGPKAETIHASAYVNKAVPQIEQPVYVAKHTFADFAVDERLKQAIAARGYTVPTPIQDQAIPYLLEGRDVVGIANTGTGKTAAFLIPLVNKILHNRSEKALIVVPTRELAVQVEEELRSLTRQLGIYSVLCIGGANMMGQMSRLKQNPAMIIGTPGRLKDLLERRALQLSNCRNIVLDEVDRMVDIGFINDIKYLISLLPHPRQSLFFSATLSPQLQTIIQSFLTNPVTVSVKVQETASGIEQDVIHVKSREEKFSKLTSLLGQPDFSKVLVFGRTKWGVDKLAKSLLQNGFSVASIHGNKSQNQRLRALNAFKQNQVKVLVATDVAARGLDIADVSHVINYDEPTSYTDYVHRIGRTGRANKMGKALTFVG